jgi:hypothetical protein
MTTSAKLAVVRFYVDADVLGLARVLAAIRTDVTYPGDPGGRVKGGRVRPPCPVTDPGTPDAVWIPETAKRDWLIITRDRHIREHRAEIEAVRANGARMVTLAGPRRSRYLPPARSPHVPMAQHRGADRQARALHRERHQDHNPRSAAHRVTARNLAPGRFSWLPARPDRTPVHDVIVMARHQRKLLRRLSA